MHIHILGICGTFMGGLAALAREKGHKVTGCDTGVYPPMSDQLRALGMELVEGYGVDQLALAPDMFRKAENTYLRAKRDFEEGYYDSCRKYANDARILAEKAEYQAIFKQSKVRSTSPDTFIACASETLGMRRDSISM